MSRIIINFTIDRPLTPMEMEAVKILSLAETSTSQTSVAESYHQAVATPAPSYGPQTATAIRSEEPESTATEDVSPAAANASVLTVKDVRDAMDAAKIRIWGPNHRNDPALTMDRKQPLVQTFIAIAKKFGADKPSLLNDQESMRKFIAECSTLEPGPSGEIEQTDLPL